MVLAKNGLVTAGVISTNVSAVGSKASSSCAALTLSPLELIITAICVLVLAALITGFGNMVSIVCAYGIGVGEREPLVSGC